METAVSAHPNILFETVELLYAYVNNIPPHSITGKGEYCLSAEAVQEMMDIACVDVDKNDSAVQYYFSDRKIFDDTGKTTCIARIMTYSERIDPEESLENAFQSLHTFWNNLTRKGLRITDVNRFTLSHTNYPEEQFVPLSQDIANLGLNPEFSQMLLESLAGHSCTLDRLQHIMAPVAKKLAPLLVPWAKRAESLAQSWRDYLGTDNAEVLLQERIRYTINGPAKSVFISLQYLNAEAGPGLIGVEAPEIYLHVGVAIPVKKDVSFNFPANALQALRLMGSKSRMQILRTLMTRPMSSRELASSLNMHLGVVTRDVSNLYDVGLLTLEITNRRRRYRTHEETIREIIQHLEDLIQYS